MSDQEQLDTQQQNVARMCPQHCGKCKQEKADNQFTDCKGKIHKVCMDCRLIRREKDKAKYLETRKAKYLEKRERVHCDTCGSDYWSLSHNKHIQSIRHRNSLLLVQSDQAC